MKKWIAVLLCAVMVAGLLSACGKKQSGITETDIENIEETQLAGGWEKPEDDTVTGESKEVFDAAVATLNEGEYTPIALIGTQVVAGMNYSFLCDVKNGNETKNQIIYVYKDLDGNVEVTDIKDVEEK